eukprot:scaffold255447_cov39-Prasinocladus_malaysianus.AAC.2
MGKRREVCHSNNTAYELPSGNDWHQPAKHSSSKLLDLEECEELTCLSELSSRCRKAERCHRHCTMTFRKQLYSPMPFMSPTPEANSESSLVSWGRELANRLPESEGSA